jgi:hypothetical protein
MSKHGLHGSPEYRSWDHLIQRCYNKKNKAFKRYGGRRIKVCPSWKNSFSAFFADMGHKPSPEHSIDRIDNDGDYCPENCRWATSTEQNNNTSRTKLLKHDATGEILSQTQWSFKLGGSKNLVANRLRKGWDIQKSISTQCK